MPSDSKSRSRLALNIKTWLMTELGNECALCETGECDGPLEIDHPYGRDWTPRRTSIYNRWLRYRREHAQKLVRLLCRYHNETVRPRQNQHTPVNEPF